MESSCLSIENQPKGPQSPLEAESASGNKNYVKLLKAGLHLGSDFGGQGRPFYICVCAFGWAFACVCDVCLLVAGMVL